MAENTRKRDHDPSESFGQGAPLYLRKLLPRIILDYIQLSIIMFLKLFSTLLSASCFVSALPEPNDVLLDAGFDKFILQLCDALHIPGISVAVVHKHSFESKVNFAALIRFCFL